VVNGWLRPHGGRLRPGEISLPNLARGSMLDASRGFMNTRLAIGFLAAAVLCGVFGFALAAAGPRMRVAGVTGGVCAAQFDKCTARCRGSAVCTQRCAANDRACRAGGKPVFR